ncbi:Uncharacterised protein [Vibrio cholerae]|nr:Uncharacterised protein [Vibrio cholerae]
MLRCWPILVPLSHEANLDRTLLSYLSGQDYAPYRKPRKRQWLRLLRVVRQ